MPLLPSYALKGFRGQVANSYGGQAEAGKPKDKMSNIQHPITNVKVNPQEAGKPKHKMSNIQHPITNVKVNPQEAGKPRTTTGFRIKCGMTIIYRP
jgi:hypothetical protein